VAIARVGSRRTSVWPSRTGLFVDILHSPRRRAFDLQRVSMKFEVGARQPNRGRSQVLSRLASTLPLGIPEPRAFTSGTRDLACSVLFRAINQNAVPINLQIGCNANLPRAQRQLATEIGGHGSRPARGKAHVVSHALPLPVRVFLIWKQRLHIRRNRFDSRL